MSYIDAFRRGDTICVSERNEHGKRLEKRLPAPFYFFYEDDDGPYQSMYGHRLERMSFKNGNKMRFAAVDLMAEGRQVFESDIKPEYRFLEDNYIDAKPPKLNVAVLDIESDRDKTKEYSSVDDPYAIINAITIEQKWLNRAVTVAVCPPTLSMDEAEALVSHMEDTFVVETEEDLLAITLDLLDDADVITGWNSRFYDLPMIIQRIRVALGGEEVEDVGDIEEYNPSAASRKHLERLCLFGEIPIPKSVMSFGSERWIFELRGKSHLDYLDLYQKFTFVELHSYKLDYVLEVEIDEKKIEYTGSLDDLWRDNFKLFVEYNRQDTVGLGKIDNKRKFITLANEMAHTACVLLKDTLGSVTIIEQAILCELHKQGLVAPDKKEVHDKETVAGAFVKLPVGGMYEWITSFDINSLYPSVIRMLNISPETVIGQVDTTDTEAKINDLIKSNKATSRTEAWRHFTGVDEYHSIEEGDQFRELSVLFEDGTTSKASGDEWRSWLKENNYSISANGTIFANRKQGIIPYCLEKWYNERVQFKQNGKGAYKAGNKDEAEYWDTIQQARKLFLNSTYGALLNAYFRFFDTRFGQSVTLSGRVVTKHMIRKASELIDGKYEFGPSAVYSDTDSVYMTLSGLLDDGVDETDLDDIVKIADTIGDLINESYPEKMMECFFVTRENGAIIESGREVVAQRGIFKDKTKKRYALYVLDNEGKRESKLKIMGMETQRSDTPKWIQEFLLDCLKIVVQQGKGETELVDNILKFRKKFYSKNAWELGSPRRVKNLQETKKQLMLYANSMSASPPRVYFAVQAAMNFNEYLDYYGDMTIPHIIDGDKVEIMYLNDRDLTNNPLGFTNIAIPVGANIQSEWIKLLPLDAKRAYDSLVTKKVTNIFDMFDWTFDPPDTTANEVFDW